MKGKKYAKTGFDLEAEQALSELFDADNDHEQFDFDGIEYSTFGRWASAVTRLGGVVTIYRKSDSDGVVFSARVGDHRKGFQFETADEFNAMMGRIADQYHLAAHKMELRRAQPEEPPEPMPSRSRKSKPPVEGSK